MHLQTSSISPRYTYCTLRHAPKHWLVVMLLIGTVTLISNACASSMFTDRRAGQDVSIAPRLNDLSHALRASDEEWPGIRNRLVCDADDVLDSIESSKVAEVDVQRVKELVAGMLLSPSLRRVPQKSSLAPRTGFRRHSASARRRCHLSSANRRDDPSHAHPSRLLRPCPV